MKRKIFGPLYAKASNSKIKMWSCTVVQEKDKTTLNVTHGYHNGKQAVDSRMVEPKNVGKSNETSPWDQGLSEAESKMKKKMDEGYVDEIEKVSDVAVQLPMLANKYSERKHLVKWPCYVSPKLDGVRLLTRFSFDGKSLGEPEFVSRKGKIYSSLKHMKDDVDKLLGYISIGDGEAYNHTLSLQEISAATKKENEDSSSIEYWLFDIVDIKEPFNVRLSKIKKFFDENSNGKNEFGFRKYGCIIEVPEYLVRNEIELEQRHKDFVKMGFEGTIVRNRDGMYILIHRSNDLLKRKDFLEEEFEVIGGKEATGNDVGTIVFRLKTKDGKEFEARPKGSREKRRKWLKDLDKLIGLKVTTRYQLLSDNGTPCQARVVCVRDYE
jgi:DNA ligase-1